MKPEERFAKIEKELDVIREHQIVEYKMRETWESRWEERMVDFYTVVDKIGHAQLKVHEALSEMHTALAKTHEAIDRLTQRQELTDAALHSLIDSIDRFVQGRGGNGHSSQ